MKFKKQRGYDIDLLTMKQAFLSSAITDVSAWVRLVDTKISILMAVTAALVSACLTILDKISITCTLTGVVIIVLSLVLLCSIVSVFVFAMRAIRGQNIEIEYPSKWYLYKSIEEYGFEAFKMDVSQMNIQDIIENMSAELYKLNAVHRRKLRMYQQSLDCLILSLIVTAAIGGLIITTLR